MAIRNLYLLTLYYLTMLFIEKDTYCHTACLLIKVLIFTRGYSNCEGIFDGYTTPVLRAYLTMLFIEKNIYRHTTCFCFV